MSWCSIREYTERQQVSTSTVRRQIQQGRIYAKKFGRDWYVQYPDKPSEPLTEPISEPLTEPISEPISFHHMRDAGATLATGEASSLQSVVEFSSKALNHYLILNDKLLAEKDIRISERDRAVVELRQELAEVQKYVRMLESELMQAKERRERPEGWQ